MIITNLAVTNFGVFRGHNEFELRPQSRDGETCPIVLFGGKNGAGKTTILQAVRLCLYGRLALGARVRTSDYNSFIRQHLHRNHVSDLPVNSARIQLVFEHTHAGQKSIYTASRSWHLDGRKVEEEVSLYRDGRILEEIPPKYWDDFLRDLIPPGLSSLFFFDGEQIQKLADSASETEALASAVGSLFNLDIVARLQDDISLYLRRQNHDAQDGLRNELQHEEDVVRQSQQHLAELSHEKAYLVSRIEGANKKIEDVRQKILEQGAEFLRDRDQLEMSMAQTEQEIEQTKAEIRNLAAELLPFAMSPEWMTRLRTRLDEEQRIEQRQVVQDSQKDLASKARDRLLDPGFQKQYGPEVSHNVWQNIANHLSEFLEPEKTAQQEIRHPVSSAERTTLFQWIDRALTAVPQEMHRLAQKLENAERLRTELERATKQIPDEDIATPLLNELNRLSEWKGNLQEKLERLGIEFYQHEIKHAELERRLARARERLAAADNQEQRILNAARVQVVLDQYLERIRALKIAALEQSLVQYFNLLCRKDTLVTEAHIDPRTHEVTLYGQNRQVVPKADLSAGEKQLYAMALLWALRSVSGRALPIIIDTPMGRLDKDHRERLLKFFFPYAAHQIILLSTDSEVDVESYDMLEPSISHVFRLDFNEDEGYTEVVRGYFRPEGVTR